MVDEEKEWIRSLARKQMLKGMLISWLLNSFAWWFVLKYRAEVKSQGAFVLSQVWFAGLTLATIYLVIVVLRDRKKSIH